MSARVHIRQNGITYKFLRIEQHSDGSIYITVLRDDERRNGAMRWDPENECFVSNPSATPSPRRVSYHVSGRVNYHSLVSSPPLFFDPLFDVEQRNHFLLISIPSVPRLSVPETERAANTRVAEAVIDIDAAIVGRISFGLIIAALDDGCQELHPRIRLGYDTFALFICCDAVLVSIPGELARHFIYAAPRGLYKTQFCGRFEAELAYHQKRAGPGVIIYGPDERGVYTLYPEVVMRVTPKATFHFSDPTLEAEVVDESRSNRLRFRIRSSGGYITNRDLRPLIQRVELDAEL